MMFETVVKLLLQGEFICAYSHPDSFHYLQQAEQHEKVDAFLMQLNYRLAHTQQKLAFYAAYQRINEAARNDIRKVFQQFRYELHPVIEWLALMMDVTQPDNAIMTGELLYFAKLLQGFEHNAALAERLNGFAKFKGFSGTDSTLKTRLEKLLNNLTEWGYLVLVDKDSLIYQVTGKLDYFYQALDFIRDNEQIAEPVTEEVTQESLF
jgi:hypothetical protein